MNRNRRERLTCKENCSIGPELLDLSSIILQVPDLSLLHLPKEILATMLQVISMMKRDFIRTLMKKGINIDM
jgi:hypothetical protein